MKRLLTGLQPSGALTGTGTWYWDNGGLTSNTTYCYRLRTQNASGYSATYSNEACGATSSGSTSTTPSTPSNVYVTNATTNSLQLNFTDNATNETSTRIERKIGSGGWQYFSYFSPLTGASSWYWVNTGLLSRTCYRLQAMNGSVGSSFSNEACGTTL